MSLYYRIVTESTYKKVLIKQELREKTFYSAFYKTFDKQFSVNFTTKLPKSDEHFLGRHEIQHLPGEGEGGWGETPTLLFQHGLLFELTIMVNSQVPLN